MFPGLEPPFITPSGRLTDSGCNLALLGYLASGAITGVAACVVNALAPGPCVILLPAALLMFGAVVLGWFFPFPGMILVGAVASACAVVAGCSALGGVLHTGSGASIAAAAGALSIGPTFGLGMASGLSRGQRRPLVPIPGVCARRRYPLGDASLCPECGQPAPVRRCERCTYPLGAADVCPECREPVAPERVKRSV